MRQRVAFFLFLYMFINNYSENGTFLYQNAILEQFDIKKLKKNLGYGHAFRAHSSCVIRRYGMAVFSRISMTSISSSETSEIRMITANILSNA